VITILRCNSAQFCSLPLHFNSEAVSSIEVIGW